jgi:hypothetical protein
VSDSTIPALVAEKIIANRSHFHELDAKAQAAQASAPPDSPRFGYVTKPLSLNKEMQFWTLEDEDLEEFLFEDLLSALYAQLTPDEWRMLPAGYAPLVSVLEFERHCMFEGWTAVSNKGADEMPYIIASYRALGLPQEAVALSKVFDAYSLCAGDEDEEFHEKLSEAYRSVPNNTPEMEDRVPHLLAYVRANPGLFGVASPA